MTASPFGRVYRPTLVSDLPLAFGFLLLVCCGLSGAWLFQQQRAADSSVRHALTVENELSLLQIEGLRAAVDVRSAILRGRSGPDVDIEAVRNRYFNHLEQLHRLTSDSAGQQSRIAVLRDLNGRRFAVLEQAVRLRRGGNTAAAARMITDPQSQATIDASKYQIDKIRGEEVRVLQLRIVHSKHIERLAFWALAASMLLTLLLAVFVFPERRKRIRALWMTKQALESALHAKASFLANMSHEIRTPMNGVLGFAELLLAGELSAEQRNRAELIDSSGRAMMSLLNDILDFSKIEAGQMRINREQFDLPHALENCVELISPAAARKGINVETRISPSIAKIVIGDGLRLRQILLNLLGNAVKFTENGSISLRAWQPPGPRSLLVVEVQDTGIGIEADRHQAIFEEFVQADSAIAPRYGGTGLGLAITMQLVRLMGGKIELGSARGEGSTFRVIIPIEPVADGVPDNKMKGALSEALPCQPNRVLLAEDHDVNQELFMDMLRRLGWRADLATNGINAVLMVDQAALQGDPYSLLLMDIHMPDMDGLEATRQIRSKGIDGERLPILALTANAYESDIAACLSAGMQAHLAKPIRMEDLDRALRTWCGGVPAPANPPQLSQSVRDRYGYRKREALQALEEMIRRGRFTEDELARVGDLLHKLAGTAAMFGERELGERARALEIGFGDWTDQDRAAKIRSSVAAIKQAA